MSRLLSTLTLTALFLALCGALPQPVYGGVGAGGPVTVTGDTSPTSQQRTINSSISATAESVQTGLMTALHIKELSLDGIAYGITRTIIKSMVSSIITWINSGFQGSPAFLSDLQGFLRDIADQVIGEAIYGSDLAFLCSPFQLDVKVALAQQYNQERSGYKPQCTLSDVTSNMENFLNGSFGDGGWPAWNELTQGSTNDPTRAYYESKIAIDAKIRNAQGQEVKLLEFGDGFLSFKVCSDTQAQSGAQKNCTITTPGRVIADQLNHALGAGQDSLITADEINEIIGALLAQLAQQALTGVYGLLGMGGNSSYTDYAYGASGSSSYLKALEDEDTTLSSSTSPYFGADITRQIKRENDYLDVADEIVARITAAEADYAEAVADAEELSSCTLSEFPETLTDIKRQTTAKIAVRNAVIPVLTELDRRFQTATSSQVQQTILQEFLKLSAGSAPIPIVSPSDPTANPADINVDYKSSSSLTSETDLVSARLMLDFQVVLGIREFEDQIEEELDDCRGSG